MLFSLKGTSKFDFEKKIVLQLENPVALRNK